MARHPGIGLPRRVVVGGIAANVMLRPLAARARPQDGMRRIGVLMVSRASDLDGQVRAAALVRALAALDWHEGGNLRIDWRWAAADPALFERYAAELVALGPEVLVAPGSLSVKVLRRQTSTIPIVFVHVTDPVGQNFVANEAHPGGNVTGFTIYDPPMAGKWLEILTQITPPVGRVAVLFNPATTPYAGLFLHVTEDAAPSLAVTVRAAPCSDNAGIDATMAGLGREGRGGLLILPNAFADLFGNAIISFAARDRLPAVYPDRHFTAAGGLMSYGIELTDLFRRAAGYVDRILKGEKPADLPVQAPTKFELVLNLKTAKALGVTFTPSLLAAADEVIE